MAKKVKDTGTMRIAPGVVCEGDKLPKEGKPVQWPVPGMGAYLYAYGCAFYEASKQRMADDAAAAATVAGATWDRIAAAGNGLMFLLSRPAKFKPGKAKNPKQPLTGEEHLQVLGLTLDEARALHLKHEARETWGRSADGVFLAYGLHVGPMPDDFPARLAKRIADEGAAASKALADAQIAQAAAMAAKPEPIPASNALVPVSAGVVAAIAALDDKAAPEPEGAVRPTDTPDIVGQIAAALSPSDASDASAAPLSGTADGDGSPEPEATATVTQEGAEVAPGNGEPASEPVQSDALCGGDGADAGVEVAEPMASSSTEPVADSACTNCEPEAVVITTAEGEHADMQAAIAGAGALALVPTGEVVTVASPLDVIATPAPEGTDTATDTGPSPQEGGDGGTPLSGGAPGVESAATADAPVAGSGDEPAPVGNSPGDAATASDASAGADTPDEPECSADPTLPDASVSTGNAVAADATQQPSETHGEIAGTATADPALVPGSALLPPGAVPLIADGGPGNAVASSDHAGDTSSASVQGEAAPGNEPSPIQPDVVDGKLWADKTEAERIAATERLNRKLAEQGRAVPAYTGSDASASGAGNGEAPVQVIASGDGSGDPLSEERAEVDARLAIASDAFASAPSEETARHYRTVARQMFKAHPRVFAMGDVYKVRTITAAYIPQTNNIGRKGRVLTLAAAQAQAPGYTEAALVEAAITPQQENAEATASAARAALLGNASDAGIVVPGDGQ